MAAPATPKRTLACQGYSEENDRGHPELSLAGSIDLDAGDFAAEEYLRGMRGGSKVVTDRDPRGADAFGLVLRFERRRGGKMLLHAPANHAPANRAPLNPARASELTDDDINDFARFEQEPEQINYRQRMFMNVIALAIVTLLLGAGVWIASTITELQKDQDCILQGRSNCAPLELPMPERD
jgi:hypothetical protein